MNAWLVVALVLGALVVLDVVALSFLVLGRRWMRRRRDDNATLDGPRTDLADEG